MLYDAPLEAPSDVAPAAASPERYDRLISELSSSEALRSSLPHDVYIRELSRLQAELVRLQEWVIYRRLKVLVIFEGRDAAGKGGTIKRITHRLNPRSCRVVALPAPTEVERTQWYFQRYVPHLPSGGEIVLFDRSWYNRAGIERVMGFCTEEEYEEFLRSVPDFERMLVRSGIILVKYWLSITYEVQHHRLLQRVEDPLKRWKLSAMDLESRRRWDQYTEAKRIMMERTHIPEARWWIVDAVDKKRARLNCIRHLLGQIPHGEAPREPVTLPELPAIPETNRGALPSELQVPLFY